MEKIKILDFSCKKMALEELAAAIQSHKLVESEFNAKGFLLNSTSHTEICFTFLEKIDTVEEVVFPSGLRIEQNISSLKETIFSIKEGEKSNFIIKSPQRSLTPLFSTLSLATGFNCIIEPISIDLFKFTKIAQELLKNFAIKAAECSNLRPQADIAAKIALKSNRNLNAYMNELIAQQGVIDAMLIEFIENGEHSTLEITKSGLIRHAPKGEFSLNNIIDIINKSRK